MPVTLKLNDPIWVLLSDWFTTDIEPDAVPALILLTWNARVLLTDAEMVAPAAQTVQAPPFSEYL